MRAAFVIGVILLAACSGSSDSPADPDGADLPGIDGGDQPTGPDAGAGDPDASDEPTATPTFVADFEDDGDFVGEDGTYPQLDGNVDTCEYDGSCSTDSMAILTGASAPAARCGDRALRVTLRNTDALVAGGRRAEVRTDLDGHARPTLGDDLWYGFSVYIPTAWTETSQKLVHQWHPMGEPGPAPAIGFRAVGNVWRLTRELDAGDDVLVETPMEKGVWTDVVVHARWSPDAEEGLLEVWITDSDPQRQVFAETLQTMEAGAAIGPVVKFGIYGSPSQLDEVSLHYDEIREAVGPNGRGVVAPACPR
jgi:hypothetical protein